MKKLIFTVMLLLPSLWLQAQSHREKTLLNQDWLFAKGHAANPDKDFNYGQALSFSKVAFLQESTLLIEPIHPPYTELRRQQMGKNIFAP